MNEFFAQTYNGSPAPAGESDWVHMRRYGMVLATSHVSEVDFRTRLCLTNVRLFYHCIYLPPGVSRGRGVVRKGKPTVAVFAGDLDSPWKCGERWLSELLPLKGEVKLLLIGRGPGVEAYARKNFPEVEATGHLPEEKAMAALAGADVLYEPSIHHIGLNLTGISDIGLGVPVVAFPTAGHSDLVGNNEAGIIVDPADPEDIVAGVRDAISSRLLLSHGAVDRFESMFHPRVVSKRIRALYEEAVVG
jgi:glycosyltransferase involved in cell wall biosynthesis